MIIVDVHSLQLGLDNNFQFQHLPDEQISGFLQPLTLLYIQINDTNIVLFLPHIFRVCEVSHLARFESEIW